MYNRTAGEIYGTATERTDRSAMRCAVLPLCPFSPIRPAVVSLFFLPVPRDYAFLPLSRGPSPLSLPNAADSSAIMQCVRRQRASNRFSFLFERLEEITFYYVAHNGKCAGFYFPRSLSITYKTSKFSEENICYSHKIYIL